MQSHETATALTSEAATAILASIGIAPLRSQALVHHHDADRELRLSVSDGFSRQTWTVDGKLRHEARDTLVFNPHEHVRITIANDMPGVRVISVGDGRLLRIRPGASASIDVARRSGSFRIAVVGEPAVSRPVEVQARGRADARTA